jgi:hypothetical protein
MQRCRIVYWWGGGMRNWAGNGDGDGGVGWQSRKVELQLLLLAEAGISLWRKWRDGREGEILRRS